MRSNQKPDRDEIAVVELRSILTETRVGELVLTTRPALEPTDNISVAAAEMRNTSHGSVVICEQGNLVGIFTERDLLRVIDGGQSLETKLSEVMTANPQTVTVDSSLFDATKSMHTGGYRRLPVIDSGGAPVGIVDVKTITHFLVEYFPEAIYNQAAHSQLIAREREGA
jgi:CBS domain-containing protein